MVLNNFNGEEQHNNSKIKSEGENNNIYKQRWMDPDQVEFILRTKKASQI